MSDEKIHWTQNELVEEAKRRFPDLKPIDWRFVCPNCGDEASPRDFKDIGADPEKVGQECIGRSLGALNKDARGTDGQGHAERGCDWVAFGLFRGPWFIESISGQEVPGFRLAAGEPVEVSA